MQHHQYMSLALQLAAQGRATVSPNPMVGCILVKDNQIIGEGYHRKAGEHHAEIVALKMAGENASGATAYITLEPCCHFGKTPPCTNALIAAGIKEIYIATLDPNPEMAGKSIVLLQQEGIKVDVGYCEAEAKQLNEIFFHYIIHQRPFVIAKWAMSLDGKTIVAPNDSKTISSVPAQQHAHDIRQYVDAILVGAETAIQDNPLLTVRLATNTSFNKHPIRIVLTGKKTLPNNLHLFDSNLPGKTIIAISNEVNHSWIPSHIETIFLPEKNGVVCLMTLLNLLGKREISSLLVEGGMKTHHAFFTENLVNKIHLYLAPVIIGSLAKKQTIKELSIEPLGNDFHMNAYL